MTKIHKVIDILLDILIITVTIIILFSVYNIIQIKLLNKDYMDFFGYAIFEVATGSMSPTINVEDMLIIKITDEIRTNDIIVYKEGNSLIVHRLLETQGDTLITKGDANNAEDKSIQKEQVVGKVIKTFPKLGMWRKIILSPQVLTLIITVIILLGIAFFHTTKKTEEKDEK